ncbi:MAG: hypothetical protein OXG76_01910 [Acidimicrobiaceae bacterium]|nr:hypothetical protein [Acidimicrobiaceae bacterium]
MSLREDIWNLVLPRVQEYRLAASDEPHVVAERCRPDRTRSHGGP